MLPTISWGDVTYFLQAREGELIIISCGHGDNAPVSPKAKRLLNKYSKISGIAYVPNSRNLYIRLGTWSHECVMTRLTSYAMPEPNMVVLQEITQSEYESATAITIET